MSETSWSGFGSCSGSFDGEAFGDARLELGEDGESVAKRTVYASRSFVSTISVGSHGRSQSKLPQLWRRERRKSSWDLVARNVGISISRGEM